jgi:hypothetical protein
MEVLVALGYLSALAVYGFPMYVSLPPFLPCYAHAEI